ncbi:MAG: hypothetical protein ACK40G_07175 [Cytophagaceae bacterium]
MLKKSLYPALFLLFFCTISFAQKIKVAESSEVIDKISRTGLYVIIDLDEKMVDKLWEKHLKTYGKTESSKKTYTLNIANISSVSSNPCKVVSKVEGSGKGTKVWWAIDLGTSHVTSSNNSSAYKAAEKILHEFALTCYREDINDQIKEAEKALNSSVKSQEKKVKEGEQLLSDIEKNKKEKANLEQKLKDNADELEKLKKDVEQNKQDQSAAAQEVEKMKKALEVVKQKLNDLK